jgi:hypothetical protein
MKKDVAGEWRILHSEDRKYFHSSPNNVMLVKQTR